MNKGEHILEIKGRITLSFDPALIRKLDDYARDNNTTKSKVIEELIEDLLKSNK